MALFKQLDSSDLADIKAWTDKVHHRINLKAHQKSELYNFDFYQEVPSKKMGKFIWEQAPSYKKPELPNSLAKASLLTWVSEEPSGRPLEEIPYILEENVHFFANSKGRNN
ncbi:hypothetical protein SteCoe_26642 [Stentor coeruleus]|uniref:Uncharacterized protein n=1 Tax=Stentor coeruleus TaxID=5963 RepID=A0A1R2BCQ1_9CILI|nr:hypothetical protein SteCoe_26642 [Stentor coeruleus]